MASALNIEKFSGKNSFSLWQIKMRALLKQQGIWAPLRDSDLDRSSIGFAQQEDKAHSTILLCLSDEVIIEVADESTALGLWNKLETLYMTKSLTNKLLLKQRLFSLKMKEGSPLKQHLDQLNSILMELRNIGVTVEDEDAALILLCSLPLSFENFVQSCVVGRDSITLEEVRSSLHSRELRHKVTHGSDDGASGLIAHQGEDRGRQGSRNRNKGKSDFKGKQSKDACFYCKEKGHWKADCPKLKSKSNVAVADHQDSASEDNYSLIVCDRSSHQIDDWILDSGASQHMTPCREYFASYTAVDAKQVKLADGNSCTRIGVGSVRFRLRDGTVKKLENVWHVPGLKKSFISLSALDRKGYRFSGGGGKLHVQKESLVVLTGTKNGLLYFLQGRPILNNSGIAARGMRATSVSGSSFQVAGKVGAQRRVSFAKAADTFGGASGSKDKPGLRSELCDPKPKPSSYLKDEHICGRPLGLRFHQKTGDLFIADAYFGILKVGTKGGLATPVTTEAEGVPFKFTNDFDIDDEGNIYFTDSSSTYQRRNFMQIVFTGEPSGRLLKYDAITKETIVLLRNLQFPNGVSLSKDGSFFVFCEGSRGRLSRYWLKGEQAGTNELFAILPGFPDNVRTNKDGDFWVAIHCRRNLYIHLSSVLPWLRSLLLKLPIPAKYQYLLHIGGKLHAVVSKYSSDGKLLQILEDSEGKVVKAVSEVEERDGKLWLGSVLMSYIAVYPIEP